MTYSSYEFASRVRVSSIRSLFWYRAESTICYDFFCWAGPEFGARLFFSGAKSTVRCCTDTVTGPLSSAIMTVIHCLFVIRNRPTFCGWGWLELVVTIPCSQLRLLPNDGSTTNKDWWDTNFGSKRTILLRRYLYLRFFTRIYVQVFVSGAALFCPRLWRNHSEQVSTYLSVVNLLVAISMLVHADSAII